jgi:probable phosphoglycerate mutase
MKSVDEVDEHEVVLIRHGETEWTLSGRHTSTTDVALTDGGRAEVVAAAGLVAGRTFALILMSSRARAVETAALMGLGPGAQVDDDLAEWNYGQYEGLTSAEIDARRAGWSLWRDGCPGGEVGAQVAARVDRAIARVRAAGGDTALVAHGHVLRVLGARWIGLGPQAGQSLVLSTASVSVLGWEHHAPAIVRWNVTAPDPRPAARP